MDYFINILWLLTWPVAIYFSFKASVYFISVFERNAALAEKADKTNKK